MKPYTAIVGCAAALAAGHACAHWKAIDLDVYDHGRIVDGSVMGSATAEARNFHDAEGRLVAFDTRERGTRDRDLEGPNDTDGQWSRGNVDPLNPLGTVLIIQGPGETVSRPSGVDDGYVAWPDDEERSSEGQRPGAGEIVFEFDGPVSAFQFTLIDIEPTQAFRDRTGSYVAFSQGTKRVAVPFADFVDPDSAYYDPSVRFGDHSANRIRPFHANELGLQQIDRVVINFGGSGAVGQIGYFADDEEEVGFAALLNESDSLFQPGLQGGGSYGDDTTGGPGPGGPGGPGGGPNPPKPPSGDEPFDPVSVPTPTAGLVGALLLGLLASKRPRR
jgi:hypothetical protein